MSKNHYASAKSYYEQSLERVRTTPYPKGQKFPPGTRVRISDKLEDCMSHFVSGKTATVQYTYAHAYGGDDVEKYSLDIDGVGEISWYYEHQLTPL